MYIYVLGHQQMAMSSQALYICLKRTINIDTLTVSVAKYLYVYTLAKQSICTHTGIAQTNFLPFETSASFPQEGNLILNHLMPGFKDVSHMRGKLSIGIPGISHKQCPGKEYIIWNISQSQPEYFLLF